MNRKYDIVILGATGFTGARVLRYICSTSSDVGRIAIAGRNSAKLATVLREFGSAGVDVLPDVDVKRPETLKSMAEQAKIVLNCVGPYRFYGEPVVQACIRARCDYMDVSGEPEFMESMQMRYSAAAKEAGCFITSAVGFDCIPAEVGAALATDSLAARGRKPHSIQSYLLLEWGPAGAAAHFATLESAVHGFRNIANLKKVRQDLEAGGFNLLPFIEGPKPKKRAACEYDSGVKGWVFPFPGADASVVKRSMCARGAAGKPVAHYVASFVIQKRLNLWLFTLFGGLVQLLCATKLGAALVLRFPGIFTYGFFSHEGPSEEQMQGTTARMCHQAYALDESTGQVEKQPSVNVDVTGPEPGYVMTPLVLVEAARELLENRPHAVQAVGAPGGVCTPGQLLMGGGGATFVARLQAAGLRISVSPQ